MKNILFIFFFSIASLAVFSQEKVSFNDMLTLLDENQIKETKEALAFYTFDDLSKEEQASYLLTEGIIKFKENDLLEGYKTLLKVKDLKAFSRKMVTYNANEYLIRIANTVSELSTAAPSLIQENCAIAEELNNPKLKIDCIYNTSYNEIIGDNYDLALKYNYQMQRIALDNNLQDELLDIENNIGTLHYFKGSYDSTLFYFNRNLERCRITKDTLAIAQRINNMAMLRAALKDHEIALENIEEAELMAQSTSDIQLQSMILRNKADILSGNQKFKEAANYYFRHLEMNDTLAAAQNALALKDIQTKYETAEQKLKNAELEAKNLRSKAGNYFLLFLLSIAIGVAAYFILNYYKSKKILKERKLAQEQRELKMMRDQELASIDAMIAGQEKERLKIASDLHDDLGSSLTAIKVSLENAKERTEDQVSKGILNNAHDILNETYVKVRRLSHTQNSRVLSENGWISSLKDLVEKINKSGKLDIEVVTSGLKGSLSNSTELNLFRIIQELINNIIKHANATEASVIITGYDHVLDIMVEDNGKGFDLKTEENKGLGLQNIKKRVENMKGNFVIDSNFNKGGCSISIEIPIV
ncbi:signal transduction histidine kinase [Nonlabens dokdonensis]|uniref:histidine kinase n=2 Tax=Nonlabens dokdonensis TaxID=328515 RepID=L7WDH2_NONDD|nr:sensor histidine kinase [Nonlabens dokdonensis]AGC78144.1 putative histidine kinase protein [Nonlabens dokdonensis DSW-6]PZX37204.1 signal transduction histidine kinase [Nonlabens dokdonensis]